MTWDVFIELAAKHWITVLFGLVMSGLTAAYRNLSKRLKKDREDAKAMQGGVVALLADRMIQLRNYYADKGYCPVYARKSAEAMYNAYHNLGGNGAITDVFEDLKRMPMEKKEG